MMQRITDHDRLSTWRGAINDPSHVGFGRNPLCGDEVWIEMIVVGETIQQIRFHGQGCVVSQACASMLCEGIEGKAVEQVLEAMPETLMEFAICEISMSRQRCALVAYEALQQTLAGLTNGSTGEAESLDKVTVSNDAQRGANMKTEAPP